MGSLKQRYMLCRCTTFKLCKALPIWTPYHHHRLGVAVHNMQLLHFGSHLYHMAYVTAYRNDSRLAPLKKFRIDSECDQTTIQWGSFYIQRQKISPTKDVHSFIWTIYKIWSFINNCSLDDSVGNRTMSISQEPLYICPNETIFSTGKACTRGSDTVPIRIKIL